MTLPSSGTISLGDVNTELGKSGTSLASMDAEELRALASPDGYPSSTGTATTMSDFYGDGLISYTHNENVGDSSNDTTRNYTVDIGAAAPDRIVVIIFFTSGVNFLNSATCTIDGVTANIQSQTFTSNSTDNSASLFTLPVTTGTTASVTFTTSASTARAGYSCYSIYGAKNTASNADGVIHEDNGFTTTSNSSATLSFPSGTTGFPHFGNVGGVFIGGFQSIDTLSPPSLPTRTFSTNSGNTVTNDGTVRHGSEARIHTAGSFFITSDAGGSNNTVTCTFDTNRIHEQIGAVFY